MRLVLNKFIKIKEDSKGTNNMIKTCCNRCGKEILYDAQLQALLPTYKIEYINSFTYYKNNSFDLCTSCQIEFNHWMEEWLKEKDNEC